MNNYIPPNLQSQQSDDLKLARFFALKMYGEQATRAKSCMIL